MECWPIKYKHIMYKQQEKGTTEKLNEYTILKQIGSGTFGKVYLVLDPYDRPFAIKHVLQDKKYKNRELQITQTLNHPNIVRLEKFFYQKINHDQYLNLVLEYVPETLSKIIKSHKRQGRLMPLERIKNYSIQIFRALAYLNKVNVCHRDIKPPNILIGEKGELKLCDFGSGKSLVEGQKNIAYICSRYYRAPQLIFGCCYYTNQIDVWSAGCVIAQIIMNKPIFEGQNSTDQLLRIIKIIGTPTQQDLDRMGVGQLKFQLPKIKALSLYKHLSKYYPDVDPLLVNFLSKIFVYDPSRRLTAEQALMDPYLSSEDYPIEGFRNL